MTIQSLCREIQALMQVTFLVMSGDLAEQSAPFVAATSCASNDVLATITKVIESVLWSMTISKI